MLVTFNHPILGTLEVGCSCCGHYSPVDVRNPNSHWAIQDFYVDSIDSVRNGFGNPVSPALWEPYADDLCSMIELMMAHDGELQRQFILELEASYEG